MQRQFLRFTYFIIPVIFLASENVIAQGVNLGIPPMRNFSKAAYHAGTQNWDAAQDSRNAIYWANNEGLLQFDGTNWTCLPVPNHTIVRAVAIDSSDRIYVGAQSEMGFYTPSINGRLEFNSLVDLLPADNRNFEDVWDIEFYGGDVFFRTKSTVFQYTGTKINIHVPGGEITALFVTPRGLIIQQNFSDLLIFESDTFRPYINVPDLESAITGIMQGIGDTIIYSSLKNGLFYLNNDLSERWKTPHDDLLTQKRVYSSSSLSDGSFALGTSLDGLIVVDKKRRVFRHLTKKNGLQNNNILHTFSDRSGNLWLGLDNGIDCVVLDSPFSSIIPDGDLQGTGYTAAVFENELYLGVSNGVYAAPWQSIYDPEKEPIFQKVTSTDGQVWSLNVVDDELMMGHHEGSFRIKNQNAEPLYAEPGAWTFVRISEDYMLGGTYAGLVLYRKSAEGWVFDQKMKGLNESCRIMVKDEDGSVWISHPYRGLYHIQWSPENKENLNVQFYNQDNGLPTNLNNYVFQIAGKAVFTTEKGVYHFDHASERFIQDNDFNRLLGIDNRVKYLKEDSKGNVWFVTDQEVGLLIVEDIGLKKEIRKKIFPELAGKLVGGFEFIYSIDERNVILGNEQGFIHYNAEPVIDTDTVMQIILSNVKATGSHDSLLFGGYYLKNGIPHVYKIPVLESDLNNLSFSYSATDYKNPSLVEYRIRLEGLEKEWSAWSAENRRNYLNLRPGSYTFKVQARIKDSRRSEVIMYTFRIRPPWYKSTAALLLYGFGVIGSFVGFLLKQQQKFENEKTLLTVTHQQKEAEHILAAEQSKAVINEIQNDKLESEIKFKNQELALTTMHLVQKGEILLTVQEALNQILEKTASPTVKKEIQHLINLLNFDVKLDEDWEHFAYQFDQVHVDFLKNLREHYPQLSSNDYKLCAFLRMNLSTKEIAPLMNISVRGVEGSRYRLRRKLDLPNDANLTEFILGLSSSAT